MAWEKFNDLLPDGVIPNMPGITKQNLIDNNIDVVISQFTEMDQNMIAAVHKYIYSKDGSYSILTQYNVQGDRRHVEGILPLNDYGAHMLNSWLKEHDIKLEFDEICNCGPDDPCQNGGACQCGKCDDNEKLQSQLPVPIKEIDGVRYIDNDLNSGIAPRLQRARD